MRGPMRRLSVMLRCALEGLLSMVLLNAAAPKFTLVERATCEVMNPV